MRTAFFRRMFRMYMRSYRYWRAANVPEQALGYKRDAASMLAFYRDAKAHNM
jgi:hypothetical protein